MFSTSASFAYGARSFSVDNMDHKGTYTIHMSATDLAGNFTRTVGTRRAHSLTPFRRGHDCGPRLGPS